MWCDVMYMIFNDGLMYISKRTRLCFKMLLFDNVLSGIFRYGDEERQNLIVRKL